MTSMEDNSSPVVAVPGSAAYISEQQRFERGPWRELKREMEEKKCRYQASLKARGRQDHDRAKANSNKMEEGMKREAQRILRKKLSNKPKKNNSGVNYNFITFEYNNTEEGRVLQYEDDCVRFRSATRAKNLYDKSSSSFDVITGNPRNSEATVHVPRKPIHPHSKESGHHKGGEAIER